MRNRFFAASCTIAVLVCGTGVIAQLTNEDMMMALMGAGIEDAAGESASFDVAAVNAASIPDVTSINVQGASATRAFGINALGEVVGSYSDATGTWGYRWRNGNVEIIQVPGSISTEAWGINPQGDIVGRYRLAGDPKTYGFLLSDGVFTDISVRKADGTLHRHTLPTKISPSREIVGCFHDTNFLADMRGYVQRGNEGTSFESFSSTMHNGVTPGGGTVAGIRFETSTRVHGYVLTRDNYVQFDYPGATFTQAWDVNSGGTVVGYFNPVASHGFLLNAKGITQVDVPGATFTRIFGINPKGDMVGVYANGTGVHGFILRGRNVKM